MANRPWMAQDALAIPGDVHVLPRHPENILPKLDPHKKDPSKDHIHKFMLTLKLMNVENEDVVCRMLPFTFEGKVMTWYFSLNP